MTHLTLTLSSCVLVQPALCCPGPLPSQRGLLTYEGTANLTQGAPCPVHSYFCRCSAQIPLLPPQLQPSSWSIPSPRTLGHYPLPLCSGTSGPASSPDAIPLLEHNIVLEGVAHIHVDKFHVPRVEPDLILHCLWVEPGVGVVRSEA